MFKRREWVKIVLFNTTKLGGIKLANPTLYNQLGNHLKVYKLAGIWLNNYLKATAKDKT